MFACLNEDLIDSHGPIHIGAVGELHWQSSSPFYLAITRVDWLVLLQSEKPGCSGDRDITGIGTGKSKKGRVDSRAIL